VPVPEPPTGTAGTGGLTPGTLRAYRAAAAAMSADGIELTLTSGFRSRAEQQQLYEQAIDKYGSPDAARVWVLPPQESQHVRGVAVDVAPREAARWLDEHGARFGLCRTMDWEWWHFEYDAGWQRAGSCPPPRRRP
jgi:LAS superfamily LD-carboxypeptidase LdcB